MHYFKFLVLLLFFFLSGFLAQGQPKDVIYFKGGDVLKGRVMEYRGGDYLSIVIAGEKIEFSGEQMNNIQKVKLLEGDYHLKEKGMWHELSLGFTTGRSSEFSKNENHSVFELVNGYRINRFIGLGVGIGYQSYRNVDIFPLFLSLTGDFLNERITPFYFINAGYGFGRDHSDEYLYYVDVKGGIMYNPGIGFKFRFKDVYITSSLGYKFQRAEFTTDQGIYSLSSFYSSQFLPQKRTQKFNRVEFKFSIGF